MKRFLTFSDGSSISYDYTAKNIKNIYIRISKSGDISVTAPNRTPISRVEDFIISKQGFICKSLIKATPKTELTNLDKIKIFDTTYPVVLQKSSKNNAAIINNTLTVCYKEDADIKQLLDRFLLSVSKDVFYNTLVDCYNNFNVCKIPFPELKIRLLKSRWGTCHVTKKIITLNANLVKYPISVLRYVIYHELSHLVVPNHSNRFYSVLKTVCPDYKMQNNILKNYNTSY